MARGSFTVTSGVGLSTTLRGRIMDKHIRQVINSELNPFLVESFELVTSNWLSQNRPDFLPIRARKSAAFWRFGVKLGGKEGKRKERNPAGIPLPGGKETLTPRSLFTMLDQGRKAGRKIESRQIGVEVIKITSQGGRTIKRKKVPIFRGGGRKKQPLFYHKYNPKTSPGFLGGNVGGGTFDIKPVFKKNKIIQGAIEARKFSEQIIEFHKKNKDIKRMLDKGYRRASREILKGKKKTVVK